MRSFKLLLISIGILSFTFILAVFRDFFHFKTIYLGIVAAISLGISFLGFFISFFDQNSFKKFAGLFGNFLILCLFAVMGIYDWTSETTCNMDSAISYPEFQSILSNSLDKSPIYFESKISEDTLNVNDTLRIKFWLNGSDFIDRVAKENGIDYGKEFFYYHQNYQSDRSFVTGERDTVVLEVLLSGLNFSNNNVIQRQITVGVNARFRSDSIKADTVYIQEIEYFVKPPSYQL